ncbi:MAG: hypothetical protein A2749_00985 [Parcubacteria group bacterium RIFCSPHIGHO2_01_FULL_45_26]|nr:MAG: hypothetical protein A2749_00985 [Parcubacteria group bacterium RIFCSPHIGHO2_01_FULL_45_26]
MIQLPYMSNKTTIAVVVILAIILGFVWWSLGAKKEEAVPTDTSTVATLPDSITVNHYFDNGNHSLEGTLTLPTPCHTLSYEATLVPRSLGEAGERVLVGFVTKPNEGLCTQVLSDKFFRVTFRAGKDALITATLDGKPVRLIFSETKEGITK